MTRRIVFFWLLMAAAVTAFGCGGGTPPPTQPQKPAVFKLSGVVKSVDTDGRRLIVAHGDIPGFMRAMTMPYKVGPSEDVSKVTPGDKIDANIVVGNADAHLENIQVTGHEDGAEKDAGGKTK